MAMLVHIQTMKCKRIYLKCGHITFNNATPGHRKTYPSRNETCISLPIIKKTCTNTFIL